MGEGRRGSKSKKKKKKKGEKKIIGNFTFGKRYDMFFVFEQSLFFILFYFYFFEDERIANFHTAIPQGKLTFDDLFSFHNFLSARGFFVFFPFLFFCLLRLDFVLVSSDFIYAENRANRRRESRREGIPEGREGERESKREN